MKNKIRIHPLFLITALYLSVIGKLYLCISYFVSIIAHELAHARMASLRGFKLKSITITPFGGIISGGERYGKEDGLLIAIAGPLFNIITAITIVALWWVCPSSYPYTEDLCYANIGLAMFNLLPVYPLDGGRVVIAIAKNKKKARKVIKIFAIVLGVLFLSFCIISIFFSFNLTIGISGCFLIYGGIFSCDETEYLHVTSEKVFDKNYRDGLRKVTYAVNEASTLYSLLSLVKKNEIASFYVCNDDGEQIFCIEEEQLYKICLDYPLSTMLENIKLSKYCIKEVEIKKINQCS